MSRSIRRPRHVAGIPPEAVRAYRRARELEAQGQTASDGGRSEYAEQRRILRRTLDRPPWRCHPLDVGDDAAYDPKHSDWDAPGALELRKQLEAAAP
jgi:hypothetical protein